MMSQSKRKYCLLSKSEVDICLVRPNPRFPFSGVSSRNPKENNIAKLIKSICEDEETDQRRELRISDLIHRLENLKTENGDLKLCFADEYSLFTLSTDNVNFKIASKRSYDLAFGLDEDQYLSVKFE